MTRRFSILLIAVVLTLLAAVPVWAQGALDAPAVTPVVAGHGKVVLHVTAGPSGAPNGFAVYWMTQADYDNYGDMWPSSQLYPGLGWAMFTGSPSINTFGGQYTTFILGPNQSIDVEIGDLYDETGVSSNSLDELDYGPSYGTDYVFCTWAIGGTTGTRSTFSLNAAGTTTQVQNCTFTQGYWKNHSSAWPTTSLKLGTVTYTQAQLLSILGQPVQGNGLVSLAHQLIAAKLNILNGASNTAVASTITAADAQIGGLVVPPIGSGSLSTNSVSAKVQTLDDYNNGITGPGHCGDTPARTATWGKMKSLYR